GGLCPQLDQPVPVPGGRGVISCENAGRREFARPTPRQQYLPSYMPDALQPVVQDPSKDALSL
ncbi:hypothetical protein P3S37_26870, partial [Enterobacter hormaechei]|uniref:hypothetical protein n=1 Tax=Enterobacter hormaechei TaxID=158836 RepID=UPI0023E47163